MVKLKTSSFKLVHSRSDINIFVIFGVRSHTMYTEHKLVKKCLQEIEESLGWGASDSWHNDMFVELSERIQQQTKVLLSPVTLKRVWGRIDYKSAPSITTLNTLSQFAGYENWRDFKAKSDIKRTSRISNKVSSNLGIIMLSASVMTVIFISFFSLKGPGNIPLPIDSESLVFTSRPIAKGLPNSVVFDVDLGEVQSDNIRIQQYWDPTKTISLKPGQKQATGQYYYPGYFRAKLLVDGKALKQHDLFIKTEGWLGTLDYRPIPKYIPSRRIEGNKLDFPNDILEEISNSSEPLTSTFHLVKDMEDISGDNFILRSKVQNVYNDKWAVCKKLVVVILGSKGAMTIGFSVPGCTSELGVMMNDVYVDGKEHDLSKMGIDLSQPQEIEIKVKNKELQVFAGGKKSFEGSYNESVGRIAGLRFRFLGAGEVLDYELAKLSEEVVISSDKANL
ncbi:hypothetical protein SAMN04488116_0827 [Flagellimonas flava]|uniref:Uncharacterized protein n=1 Tax=Flagellimonas flava TaxID=570519 RepID=A0A1M5INL0_9FLAO|nr:hypothetical protein SAMN04488116_0827 [Allomuricauda flava]